MLRCPFLPPIGFYPSRSPSSPRMVRYIPTYVDTVLNLSLNLEEALILLDAKIQRASQGISLVLEVCVVSLNIVDKRNSDGLIRRVVTTLISTISTVLIFRR
jgi:hypothetical protein